MRKKHHKSPLHSVRFPQFLPQKFTEFKSIPKKITLLGAQFCFEFFFKILEFHCATKSVCCFTTYFTLGCIFVPATLGQLAGSLGQKVLKKFLQRALLEYALPLFIVVIEKSLSDLSHDLGCWQILEAGPRQGRG